jgi:hypothetical protein
VLVLISSKFLQFWLKIDPEQEIYEVNNRHLTEETAFDLKTSNFTLGFAVKDYFKDEYKYDASLVEWVVHVYDKIGNHLEPTQVIGVHPCHENDWKKFH